MKKFLLVLLCTVCMTASARVDLSQFRGKQIKTSSLNKALMVKSFESQLASAPYSYSPVARNSKPARAAQKRIDASKAYGTIIESTYNDYTKQGMGAFYMTSEVTLESIEDNFVLVEADPDEGIDEVTHPVNVSLQGMMQGLIPELVGYQDVDADTLWIPAQMALQDETYGAMALFGFVPGQEEGYVGLCDSVVFKMVTEADGSIGYKLADNLIGFGLLMLEGEYRGSLYDGLYEENMLLHQPNMIAFYQTHSMDQQENWSDFENGEPKYVYLQDTGDTYRVHGFPNIMFNVDMVLTMYPGEEENSFEVEMPQDMIYYSRNNAMIILANFSEEAKINDPVIGTINDGIFEFGTRNEQGSFDYATFAPCFITQDTEGNRSLRWWGLESSMHRLVPFNKVEGINTVLSPSASAAMGQFNLAGQRVNAATKGINIQNGVKALVK